MIRQDLRWMVGNGERICVYGDRWIPDPLNSVVISERGDLP